MACLTLALLGPPDVTRAGQPVTGFATDKVRALLVYLAMEADHAHRRDTLAELLWPEQPAQVARNSLRQALATLRQAIGDRSATPPFLLISAETVQFNTASDYWLDVAAFTSLLEACREHPHDRPERCTPCAHRLQQAVTLYRGSFLDQFFVRDSVALEEWMVLLRERLRRRAFAAVARLTTYYERRGAYVLAEQYAWRQVEMDPWREEAQRQLMRVLALSGQRSAALRQYDVCRQTLADELGVVPAPETTALCEQIRTGALTRPPEPRGSTHPLPASISPFVGRQRVRAELAELLTNRAVRLVTLVGAPGIGKSRLALQVAADLQADFDDATAVVLLASLNDGALVVPAIAQVLEVKERPGQSLLDSLKDYLADKHLLLVLDNFEHLLAAAPTAVELLRAAPGLTVFVTSRALLNLSGEHAFQVPPLTLPDVNQTTVLTAVAQAEAVALFVQRAQTVKPDFELTTENGPAVAAICRRLDGLPLAIELAATRITLLPADALLAKLDSRLQILTSGMRDLDARQRSLRATLDWSYQLLDVDQQHLFAGLGVFAGSCTLDAVEAVWPAFGDLHGDLLTSLQSLVDHCLVQQREWHGEPRFTMLETIREYALERLEASGRAEPVRRACAAYFTRLAEAAEDPLRGPDQGVWLRRLEAEHANVRAVLHWAVERSEAMTAGRLAGALWRFWWMQGHLSEGRRWLERARVLLACASGPPPDVPAEPVRPPRASKLAAQTKALHGAGSLAWAQGDTPAAIARFTESLELPRHEGDTPQRARTASNLVTALIFHGEYARAEAVVTEALRLAHELGNTRVDAHLLANRAALAYYQGRLEAARTVYAQSIALHRASADRHSLAMILINLGDVELDLGAYDRARAVFSESLALFVELASPWGIAYGLEGLAAVMASEGQSLARAYRAAQLVGAAHRLQDASSFFRPPASQRRYARRLAAVRSALGEAAFAQATAEGRAMSLDQAVAVANSGDP